MYCKPLLGPGSQHAIAVLNLGDRAATVTVQWSWLAAGCTSDGKAADAPASAGAVPDAATVRDLWAREDVGVVPSLPVALESHASALYSVRLHAPLFEVDVDWPAFLAEQDMLFDWHRNDSSASGWGSATRNHTLPTNWLQGPALGNGVVGDVVYFCNPAPRQPGRTEGQASFGHGRGGYCEAGNATAKAELRIELGRQDLYSARRPVEHFWNGVRLPVGCKGIHTAVLTHSWWPWRRFLDLQTCSARRPQQGKYFFLISPCNNLHRQAPALVSLRSLLLPCRPSCENRGRGQIRVDAAVVARRRAARVPDDGSRGAHVSTLRSRDRARARGGACNDGRRGRDRGVCGADEVR